MIHCMKVTFFKPIFIILCLQYNCYGQKYQFDEIYAIPAKKKLSDILIIAYGTIETRMFTENLANKLNEVFKKENIQTQYNYLGKNPITSDSAIIEFANGNYDAIMIIAPIDSMSYQLKHQMGKGTMDRQILGLGPYSSGFRTISYTQKFEIQVVETNIKASVIWDATLFVESNFRKQIIYSQIARKILSSLKARSIVH